MSPPATGASWQGSSSVWWSGQVTYPPDRFGSSWGILNMISEPSPNRASLRAVNPHTVAGLSNSLQRLDHLRLLCELLVSATMVSANIRSSGSNLIYLSAFSNVTSSITRPLSARPGSVDTGTIVGDRHLQADRTSIQPSSPMDRFTPCPSFQRIASVNVANRALSSRQISVSPIGWSY